MGVAIYRQLIGYLRANRFLALIASNAARNKGAVRGLPAGYIFGVILKSHSKTGFLRGLFGVIFRNPCSRALQRAGERGKGKGGEGEEKGGGRKKRKKREISPDFPARRANCQTIFENAALVRHSLLGEKRRRKEEKRKEKKKGKKRRRKGKKEKGGPQIAAKIPGAAPPDPPFSWGAAPPRPPLL